MISMHKNNTVVQVAIPRIQSFREQMKEAKIGIASLLLDSGKHDGSKLLSFKVTSEYVVVRYGILKNAFRRDRTYGY